MVLRWPLRAWRDLTRMLFGIVLPVQNAGRFEVKLNEGDVVVETCAKSTRMKRPIYLLRRLGAMYGVPLTSARGWTLTNEGRVGYLRITLAPYHNKLWVLRLTCLTFNLLFANGGFRYVGLLDQTILSSLTHCLTNCSHFFRVVGTTSRALQLRLPDLLARSLLRTNNILLDGSKVEGNTFYTYYSEVSTVWDVWDYYNEFSTLPRSAGERQVALPIGELLSSFYSSRDYSNVEVNGLAHSGGEGIIDSGKYLRTDVTDILRTAYRRPVRGNFQVHQPDNQEVFFIALPFKSQEDLVLTSARGKLEVLLGVARITGRQYFFSGSEVRSYSNQVLARMVVGKDALTFWFNLQELSRHPYMLWGYDYSKRKYIDINLLQEEVKNAQNDRLLDTYRRSGQLVLTVRRYEVR